MPSTQKITVKVIVSGQSVSIEVNLHQQVEQLVHESLQRTGNKGQPPGEWELRTVDGRLIPQSQTVEAAEIVEGSSLFLNPRAGAGG